MTLERILSKIENARELDFGDIFDKSFSLFKKIWLQGFVAVLLIAILSIALSMGYAFLLGAIGIDTNTLDPNEFRDFDIDKILSFYSSNALYNIPVSIINAIWSFGILAGFYRICQQKDEDNSKSEDYFYFFKGEYLNKIIILSLAYTGITVLAQMLCFIPYIYALVPLAYFAVIFAFNAEKRPEEIIKLSFKLGNKKWLISFGTLFVTGIIACLGLLACFIGVLFTVSLIYMPAYIIYKEIIGFEEDDEIMRIGEE